MQISLCVAVSLDGKITDAHHSVEWISPEDQLHLKKTIREYDALVMGRTTFDNYKSRINRNYKKLRIILTKHPEKYAHDSLPGYVEFFDYMPHEVITMLEKRGCVKILILGGSYIFRDFLVHDLYTDLYITIEPLFLGNGTSFTQPFNAQRILKLAQSTILNSTGTILLHYTRPHTHA